MKNPEKKCPFGKKIHSAHETNGICVVSSVQNLSIQQQSFQASYVK